MVEVRRWQPFGITVGVLGSAPALLEQFVVRPAGQSELIDVGAPAGGPRGDMMHLALIAQHITARTGATTVFGIQHQACPAVASRLA